MFELDVFSPGGKNLKAERKTRPLGDKTIPELEALATEDDSDEALFELVRRNKNYVHSDLARAKIRLWNWQKQLLLDVRLPPTARVLRGLSPAVTAQAHLERMGAALAYAHSKKKGWNSGVLLAVAEKCLERILKARTHLAKDDRASVAALAVSHSLHATVVDALLRDSDEDRRKSRPKKQEALWRQLAFELFGDAEQHAWAAVLHREAQRSINAKNKSL